MSPLSPRAVQSLRCNNFFSNSHSVHKLSFDGNDFSAKHAPGIWMYNYLWLSFERADPRPQFALQRGALPLFLFLLNGMILLSDKGMCPLVHDSFQFAQSLLYFILKFFSDHSPKISATKITT